MDQKGFVPLFICPETWPTILVVSRDISEQNKRIETMKYTWEEVAQLRAEQVISTNSKINVPHQKQNRYKQGQWFCLKQT